MLTVFPSRLLRAVCVSDSHNDNASPSIPDGDIPIHAGDMDPHHTRFDLRAVELFTSEAARAFGIHYLDQEVRIVAQYKRIAVVRPFFASLAITTSAGATGGCFKQERRHSGRSMLTLSPVSTTLERCWGGKASMKRRKRCTGERQKDMRRCWA